MLNADMSKQENEIATNKTKAAKLDILRMKMTSSLKSSKNFRKNFRKKKVSLR